MLLMLIQTKGLHVQNTLCNKRVKYSKWIEYTRCMKRAFLGQICPVCVTALGALRPERFDWVQAQQYGWVWWQHWCMPHTLSNTIYEFLRIYTPYTFVCRVKPFIFMRKLHNGHNYCFQCCLFYGVVVLPLLGWHYMHVMWSLKTFGKPLSFSCSVVLCLCIHGARYASSFHCANTAELTNTWPEGIIFHPFLYSTLSLHRAIATKKKQTIQ